MQCLNGIRELPQPLKGSAVTIGNFDGVHLGHKALIQRLLMHAKQCGKPAVVITFEPHPTKVLYPEKGLTRIFSARDQVDQFRQLGVDILVIEAFSREFSQLSPEQFFSRFVIQPLAPHAVVVGHDFSFGADRKGSLDFLQKQSESLGFSLEIVSAVTIGESAVSSSRIRKSLLCGDVELARALLGRNFYLEGIVIKGAGRGRKIGVPTANLQTQAETLPAPGVYACRVIVRGQELKAAVNIGYNPTFTNNSASRLSIEAHILDFDADLYGEALRLEFIKFLRDEKKFAQVSLLIEQIHRDIDQARRTLDA